jgi:hypothetical protein
MIYGNNVDANFEYLQRRMVEKALDALQAKHDELAELVECYLACDSAYSGCGGIINAAIMFFITATILTLQ